MRMLEKLIWKLYKHEKYSVTLSATCEFDLKAVGWFEGWVTDLSESFDWKLSFEQKYFW